MLNTKLNTNIKAIIEVILIMCNIFRRNAPKYSIKDEYRNYLASIEDNYTKNYIEQRLLGQAEWYDKKSTHFQNQFKYLTIISLFLSSAVPVMSLFKTTTKIKIAIASASSLVTVITGVLSLYKSKELWLQYRNSCESLKSILHQYFMNSGIFNCENENIKNTLLIEKCESIIASDVNNWSSLNTTRNTNQSSTNS